ncbi:hypothetical protein [Bizionia echini]|uniref:hypothetical protein n=1 Tax=Bizionia echini TaxID=649333 RepID=UPI0030DC259C
MKHLKLLLLCLLFVGSMNAQQRMDKISQSLHVNDDVTIDLNASYTNIIIDTWNKDIIEVDAYIESDALSKDALKKQLDAWKVRVEGSKDFITINSNSEGDSWSESMVLFDTKSLDLAMQNLEIELADMPIMPMVDGLMESLDLAKMPKMPKMPKLPDLPEGMNTTNFDFERYKNEGEAYMQKWSREYSAKYGEAYAKKMENWAKHVDTEAFEKYEKDMEAWGETFGKQFGDTFGKDMEAWGEAFGEKFGKSMEAWGEEFGKNMEAWGEQFGKEMEERAKRMEENQEKYESQRQENEAKYQALFNSDMGKNMTIKKTLKIKIPKNSKLKLNVRHGEMKFTSVIHNLKAELNHTKFLASSIDGEHTTINASYSSLLIKDWKMGNLELNFVEDATIQNINGLVLNSNSSNIHIDKLSGNAIINGSFGDLAIHNITDNFNTINITLDNSNANLKLPIADYKLQYHGKNSQFKHPKNTKGQFVTMFNSGSISNNRTIVVNAKYSHVNMN